MAQVPLPNGDTINVPDTYTREQVQAVVDQVMAHPDYKAAPAPQEGSMVGEAAKGSLEGVAGIADMPLNLIRFGDRVIQHARGQEPHQINYPDSPLMGRARGADFQTAARRTLGQPAPGYETTRNVASYVAPIALTLGTEGLINGGLRAGLTGVAKAAPVAAASKAGEVTGGAVGGFVGGDVGRDIGEFVGGGVGSGLPTFARPGAQNIVNRTLTTPDTQRRITLADANNIPLSMGLVGSKAADWLEDSSIVPTMGFGPAADTRRAQHGAISARAQQIADDIRGGPAAGPISKESVTGDVRSAAQTAKEGYQRSTRTLQNGLERRVGERTPVEVSPIIQHVQGDTGLRAVGEFGEPAPVPNDQVPMMDRYWESSRKRDTLPPVIDQLQRDRVAPFDPALDAELNRNLASAQNAMTDRIDGQDIRGRYPRNWAPDPETGQSPGRGMGRSAAIGADPLSRGRLASVVDDTQRQIDQNRGVAYGALKDWRTDLGRAMEGREALHPDYEPTLYGLATEQMRGAAEQQGVSPLLFDAINNRTRSYYAGPNETKGPLPIVDDIATGKNGSAYGSVFGETNRTSPEIVNAIRDKAPGPMRQALGNNFELQLRGADAGFAPDPNTLELLKPKQSAEFIRGMGDAERQAYAGADPRRNVEANPQIEGDMASLGDLLKIESQRRTRTLPGSGTSISAPAIGLSLPGMAMGSMGLLGPLGAALTAALPAASAYGIGKAMTSPSFVRWAAENPESLGAIGQRALPSMAGAAPAVIPQNEQQ
jgi:hypothetical protein